MTLTIEALVAERAALELSAKTWAARVDELVRELDEARAALAHSEESCRKEACLGLDLEAQVLAGQTLLADIERQVRERCKIVCAGREGYTSARHASECMMVELFGELPT